MEMIAAVPEKEPLYVRPYRSMGETRIERRLHLRATLLAVLRQEGDLGHQDTYYSAGWDREGRRLHCGVRVSTTGATFIAVAPYCTDEPHCTEGEREVAIYKV
jgi:hypothetical protein